MRKPAAAVLFLTVVVDLLGFGIVLPLLPRYGAMFGASPGEIGILMASFSAMQFLFAPVWGRLSDRFGRRPLLILGLFGSVGSYALFAVAETYALLLASRILAGLFGATIGTAQAYIADVTEGAERGRGMALIGAAFGIGFTLGPAIGGLGYDLLGPRAPGFIAAGFSFVALVMAVFVLGEPERHRPPQRERGWIHTGAIRYVLRTPTLPLVLVLQIVATFAFAKLEGTLSLLTDANLGYDERQNGFLFTYVGFCLLLSQGFLVRRYMAKMGELNFVVLGSILLALGMLAVGHAEATWTAALALPLAIVGFSMLSPSLASLLSRRSPAAMQGEILGLGQSGLSLARILGPYVGNVLFGITPAAPYWAGAAIMGIAFLGALALRSAPVPETA